MPKATILFADNDAEFLKVRSELLEHNGYEVIAVTNPIEAQRALEHEQVDLAILDLRLLKDEDEKDVSGLNLAKRVAPSVPKIIFTKFATVEAVREALGPVMEDQPPAVDFIAKHEGPEALLKAIRKVLKFEVREFQETLDSISEELQRDYEDVQQEAKMSYRAGLGVAIAGILFIFAGIGLTLSGTSATGLISVFGGVLAETLSIVLFKRAGVVNRRLETLHGELLQFRRIEALLASCGEYSSQEEQEECQRQVRELIRQIAEQRSLGHSGSGNHPPYLVPGVTVSAYGRDIRGQGKNSVC